MRLYVIVKSKYCKQHIINNPLTHHCISTLQLENAYQAVIKVKHKGLSSNFARSANL